MKKVDDKLLDFIYNHCELLRDCVRTIENNFNRFRDKDFLEGIDNIETITKLGDLLDCVLGYCYDGTYCDKRFLAEMEEIENGKSK